MNTNNNLQEIHLMTFLLLTYQRWPI